MIEYLSDNEPKELQIMVRTTGNFERNHSLGMMFANYILSDLFNPVCTLDINFINDML